MWETRQITGRYLLQNRLYATILNKRLVSFTEDYDLRDPTQAGFRPGKSTIHQIFALQHFVDAATPEQPLYCCFLDLKSAYDRVPKQALWEALRRLGIGGKGLGAFQSFHTNSTMSMKIDGRTGGSVPSVSGVKQGCPLSPTLFGLFIDGLFHYLETTNGRRQRERKRENKIRLQTRVRRLRNAVRHKASLLHMLASNSQVLTHIFSSSVLSFHHQPDL